MSKDTAERFRKTILEDRVKSGLPKFNSREELDKFASQAFKKFVSTNSKNTTDRLGAVYSELDKIDRPSVVRILSGMEQEICTQYKKYGYTKKMLESLTKLDYGSYIKQIVNIRPSNYHDIMGSSEADEYFSCLDNYYGIKNSNKFVIGIKDLKKFQSDDFADLSEITEEDLDKYGDMTIDFYLDKGKYLNLSLKSLRGTYTIEINGKKHSIVNLALNSSIGGRMGNLWSISLLKDRYPRVYLETSSNDNKCGYCDCKNIQRYINNSYLPDIDEVVSLPVQYCMVGKLRCDKCMCNDKIVPSFSDPELDFDIPLDYHTMIKVWCHVLLSYKNRNNLYRKNAKKRELRKKAEVHTVRKNTEGRYGVVSLKSYTEYEKKERKEW